MKIAKDIADKIGTVEYGWEPPASIRREASMQKCIIAFGASDDLCELRGLIDDEVGCYDGGCISGACDELAQRGVELFADWCKSDDGWAWSYRTNMPFSRFRMFEDGEKYCQGIVIEVGTSFEDRGTDDPRYIDADKIEKRFESYMQSCEDANDITAARVFADCIAELRDEKTADVAPVAHGHWEDIGEKYYKRKYECSVCHRMIVCHPDDLGE